jgi:hypothetical protein
MEDIHTWLLLLIAVTQFATVAVGLLSKRDIRKIEVATNSIMSARLVETATAARAEGRLQQKSETDAEKL